MTNSSRFLLLALLLPFQASAFVVRPIHTAPVQVVPTTATFASTIYSDFETNRRLEEQQQASVQHHDYTAPVVISRRRLQPMDLPARHHDEIDENSSKVLRSLEAMIGRGAMLAAFVLMATEVTTGMSLPEQLSKLVS